MRVRIKELAKKAGKTFLKISQEIDVTERTLYLWDSGEKMPNKSNTERLRKNFNCEINELFEFS